MFISIAFRSACALNVFMFSRETPKKFLGLPVTCKHVVHDIRESVVGSLDFFGEEFWKRDRGLNSI